MYKELRKGNWAQKFAPALGAGQGLFELNTTQADEGNRTPNLLITNQLLCQLSYVSLKTGRKRQTRMIKGKSGSVNGLGRDKLEPAASRAELPLLRTCQRVDKGWLMVLVGCSPLLTAPVLVR